MRIDWYKAAKNEMQRFKEACIALENAQPKPDYKAMLDSQDAADTHDEDFYREMGIRSV
jgi:hypothetical protein